MKYLSVCSGIEAATVAWHGLGWTPVAFSEIEPFPAAVLAHHYQTVPNLGDLTKYREWPEELLAQVDLLVGGTPCQAFSVAGKRQSLDDERGNLSLVYVNLYHHINEARKRHGRPPAIALWENVPGVLSTKDNAFGCFLGGLLGCDEAPQTESGKWDKAGFLSSETVRVGYRVLDAQYFGVAQRRRRVFLVAVPCELVERSGERACPSAILSLRESVLGNPPTRGAAWEGVARAIASGTASSSRGVERPGESRGQDDVVIWSASDQANAERFVDQAGTLNCNMVQRGGWISCHPDPAYAISAGNQSKGGVFGSGRDSQDTFVTCFHPTQDPISSTDGSTHAVSTGSGGGCATHAVCVSGQRTHALTTRAAACEEDGTGRGTPIVTHGGVFDCSVAFQINADADRQNSAALTPSPDAEGRIRLRDPGIGIGENGDPMFTMQSTKPHAVAFKPSHFTRGKDGAPSEVVAPLSADADKGDQDTVVAYDITGTLATNGASKTDVYTALLGRAPGQSQSSTTTVVAFTQNSRDEVRLINDDGKIAGSIGADGGMHQTNYLAYGVTTEQTPKFSEETALTITRQYPTGGGQPQCVAFANRTRDGIKVPEVMKDGVVPALTNPGNGGRSDAVNVASAMQVRRLTPTECAYLQGFPADYLDVTFRKKPAADGPKYRALGNSMAVPCMWWLGYRIDKAIRQDNQ